MIRTVGVYLLFLAVALRAMVVFADDPQLPLVVVLLTAFGVFLFAGSWFIRYKISSLVAVVRLDSEQKQFWSHTALPFLYLLLQSGLVSALLFVPATEDFFGNLFILLSLDAVFYFGRRWGFLVITTFFLITAIALASSAQGPLFGMVMASLYAGVGFLFGGYAHQVQRAELARQQNQHLMAELQIAHQQLQGYVNQAEEVAIEQERSRLARELHDSVTQTVFSMNLTVQGACLLFAREPNRVGPQLERLEQLAASAMREIQTLVLHLQPKPPSAESLPVALHHLVAERGVRDGLQVSLQVSGERVLPAPVVIGLYAIVQEALTNVVRHAGTNQAFVHLNLTESNGYLEIRDRGSGFALEAALAEAGHLGVIGMADRAREIGWSLVIDSAHGQGTCIRVEERSQERVG